MLRYLFCFAALFPTSLLAEPESDVFFEVGVGLIDENFLVLPKQSDLDAALVPMISVGIGYEIQLQQDWKLQTSFSISHAQTDRFTAENPWQTGNANLQNTGLWVDTRLKYTALFDDVHPFVSVGAGRVYGIYKDDETQISGWENGVRAFAGLEFDISPDVSFSMAFGTGHLD